MIDPGLANDRVANEVVIRIRVLPVMGSGYVGGGVAKRIRLSDNRPLADPEADVELGLTAEP